MRSSILCEDRLRQSLPLPQGWVFGVFLRDLVDTSLIQGKLSKG